MLLERSKPRAASGRIDRRMEPIEEETLDPADWGELRAVGHRMIDDLIDYLARVRERAPWQPVPADTRARGSR